MFLLGQWKNFEEMEINLSLPELEAILQASRNQQYAKHKFMAALQNIDLDDGEDSEDKFAEIEARAKAKAVGMTTEQYDLADIGVGVETE